MGIVRTPVDSGPRIELATATRPELLTDASGRPVWTVRSRAEERALAALARTLGGATAAAGTTVAAPEPHADDGTGRTVVPLGIEAVAPAREYAHLTGRALAAPLADPSSLRERGPFDVLVTLARNVDDALCEALYGDDAPDWGAAPGVICGKSPHELRTQVLLRSAARALDPIGPVTWVDMLMLARGPAGQAAGGPRRAVYAGASPSQVRDALGAGAGLLRVVTHSDGIDAYLADGLTLCPLPAARGDRLRSPRCVDTGWCHRAGTTVSAARAGDRLLPASAIAARLLIWHVCYGVMPATGPLARVLDRNWGLLPQLVANPRVGALLTTWGIEAVGTPARLLAALSAGLPLGVALAEQRRHDAATGAGTPLLLIGDPDLRVPVERSPLLDPGSGSRWARPRAVSGGGRPLEFLNAAIRRQVLRDPRARATGGEALAALAAWQRDDVAADSARAAVVRHLVANNRMFFLDWGAMARAAGRLPRDTCGACGRRRWAQRFLAPGGVVRRFATCPGCGVVEDAPEESRLALRVVDGAFELTGPLPGRAFAGGLLLGGSEPSDLRSFDWPRTRDGAPVRRFEPPTPWPVGPLRAVAVVLTGFDATLLQQPARAPA